MKSLLIFISGAVSLVLAVLGWSYYEKWRSAEVYTSLGDGLSVSLLRDAVMAAESYKIIFGFYPDSIEELRGGSIHTDPASENCKCPTDYYYELGEDKKTYYLFSKGRDCIAFTMDDLHPELTAKERVNIGLREPVINTASKKMESCNGI